MMHLIIIFFIGFCLAMPAFMGDFFVAHDLLFHLNWNRAFSDQFWNGDVYPRWLATMNGGRGSPAFFFYGPVPFFVSAFLKPFLIHDQNGWLQLGLSVSVALALSGLFAYLWLRKIVDKHSAFMAAVVYMILPYHLFVDLYHRLSLAEFWSFVWMPLILYATREIVENKDKGILKFSIAYALLIMTHLPSSLIFSLIPLAYTIAIATTGLKIKNSVRVLSSIGIGLALSSIYLIPVLLTHENVSLSLSTVGGWRYENNFLNFVPTFDGIKEFSTYIYEITLFTILIGCYFYLRNFKYTINKKYASFWMMVVVISLLLMLPISTTVWKNITILQKIQFPWRFNILISLAIPALVAVMLRSEYEEKKTLFTNGHLAVSGLIVVFLTLGVVFSFNKSNENKNEESLLLIEKSLAYKLGAPEYLPKWVPGPEKEKFIFGNIDHNEIITDSINSVPSDQLIQNEPRILEFEIDGSTDAELTIGQFYYPGWTATLKEESRKLPVGISSEGLLAVSVPSGRHRVLVKLEPTIEERLGQIISLISVFTLAVLYSARFMRSM